MLYLLSYDIEDDADRARMHKLLKNRGDRVQRSVFECLLDDQQLQEVLDRAERLLRGDFDSLRVYGLCGACFERVRVVGCGRPPLEEEVFVV